MTEPRPAGQPHDRVEELYRRAARMFDLNTEGLVLNETVRPNWTSRGAEFWYRRQLRSGWEHVLVAGDNSVRPAFDHAEMTAALRGSGAGANANALDVVGLGSDGRWAVRVDGHVWNVETSSPAVAVPARPPVPPRWLPDPGHRRAVYNEGFNLHLVDIESGERSELTNDGQDGAAWGTPPHGPPYGVAASRSGAEFPPVGWAWSPSGRWLVGGMWDSRAVRPYPVVQSVPDHGHRPIVWRVRQPLLGEPEAEFSLWVFDLDAGERRRVAPLDGLRTFLDPPVPIAWSDDEARFYLVAMHDGGRELRLTEVDARTGMARTVVSERPPGYVQPGSELYSKPSVRLVRNGREALWWSQRSGWGHLYRYEVETGRCLGALTSGEWLVRDIVHVDEANGWLFFTGAGREGGDPYRRRLYRVDMAGGAPVLLTPEDADHDFQGAPVSGISLQYGAPEPANLFSPDGHAFVDHYSTVQDPGRIVLRSTRDGSIHVELERPDASMLHEAGWRPPEPFVAKAADGDTDLYGVLYRPSSGDTGPVPLIDGIYAGPQVSVAPHGFGAARRALGVTGRASLAALGFAVAVVDGRGTPLRSRAFHDAGFARFPDLALDDHVAVLRQLCARDPSLDADRIGVYGHSFGGYTSARAILRHPDVFKVAVSSAGCHNFQGMYDSAARLYLQPPTYAGSVERPDEDAVPTNYAHLDNATLAGRLAGKLLLAYGDLDENAYPAVTLDLIRALIEHNRSPDLLYLPNRAHGFVREPYFVRRLWDYFITHLMDERPPRDFLLEVRGPAPPPAG